LSNHPFETNDGAVESPYGEPVMQSTQESRLTTRILFWVVTICVLMFSTVTVLTVLLERRDLYQRAQRDAQSNVARNIAAISTGLWNFDIIGLKATLQGLTQTGSIVRVEVLNRQQQVAAIERDHKEEPEHIWEVPILDPEKSGQIGTLKVSESYEEVRDLFIRNLAIELIAELVKIGGLAALLFVVIYGLITRHLRTLARDVSDLKAGSSTALIKLQRRKVHHDELDTLVSSINRFRNERAEAEEERARLWNVSQDLLVVTDMKGRFVSVNPAWNAMLGYSEEDLLNNTSEWLVHPDDWVKTRANQRRVVTGDNIPYFENRLRDKHGSYRWLSWKAVAEKGQIYAVIRDITDLKNAANQVQVARRELAGITRDTTMGAMTASIAHELRQPLASLINNANAGLRWLNRAEPDLDEASAAFKRIVENGNRANSVIAGIRSMFRNDLGKRGSVNLNDLIEEVLAIVRGELERHQVLLETKLCDRLPTIIAERTQLQQVVLNLVINAVDSMSSVTDRKRVLFVRSEMSESDHILITVEDSGTGIEPSNTSRVFDAFFTTKDQGMGIGLSVCRTIIESHGGQLSFSARSPHGTSFSAKLPTSPPNIK
jgi:PAS domain S-box-containing protein